MSFQFSPETLKEELERQIAKMELAVKSSQKRVDDLSKQMIENPQRGTNSRSGDPRARQLTSMKQSLSEQNSTLSGLKDQLSLISREIDVRNRKTEESQKTLNESQNSVNSSILNNLKNINNEVIGQTMQNESLRNKIIIGGLVGVLAIAVMKKR